MANSYKAFGYLNDAVDRAQMFALTPSFDSRHLSHELNHTRPIALHNRVHWRNLMKRVANILLCLSTLLGLAAAPPVARVAPTKVNLGGQTVVDDYWWLRDKSDPAVIDYLNAENAYTDQAMNPTVALQQTLYQEMLGRIRQDDETVPVLNGGWWYSDRGVTGKQYRVYLRRKGSPTATPEVMADCNALAEGHPYFDFVSGPVTDDSTLWAFATDITGNRQYVLGIKNLSTGALLTDSIHLVDSFVWSADGKSIYYTTEDAAKRPCRVYRHQVGTPAQADELICEEKDEQFSLNLDMTQDRRFILIESSSKMSSEVSFILRDRPAPPRVIEPRRENVQYFADHRNGRFYIRVNDTSPDFRLVTCPDSQPAKSSWSELIPARPRISISNFSVFAHHLVVSERRDGLPQIGISKLPEGDADPAAGGKIEPPDIVFNEPDFDVSLATNPEFNPSAIRLDYSSLTTPHRVYDFDLAAGTLKLLKEQPVGGGFNASTYQEERLFATARDGTKIPISLVYRVARPSPTASVKPASESGVVTLAATSSPSTNRSDAAPQRVPRPLVLDGYGSYGFPEDVYFSSARLSLLDRGVIFAIAHVRGGGEYGRSWYNAGRMATKPNTFGDFIAAAEFLEKENYTSPGKLAIIGGSAGGLLIGAVLNERPDLFHAAVAEVPWVDVLADMCDPSVPLTTVEYSEWGNPNIPAERAVIASYCPYANVHPQAYPAILVRESLNDSQVQYWDAARWVARLRAAKKQAGEAGNRELLLKMDMNAGHGGASGRISELQDEAFNQAWLLTRLEVVSPAVK